MSIEKAVIQLLKDQYSTTQDDPIEITLDMTLEQVGFDSLDHVELMMELEEEFDIYISDEEWDKAIADSTTVRGLVAFVEQECAVGDGFDAVQEQPEKHPQTVGNFSLDELAKNVGKMRYDKLAEFIGLLATDLQQQRAGDQQKGRTKLAAALDLASIHLTRAEEEINTAWKICKPYMENKT